MLGGNPAPNRKPPGGAGGVEERSQDNDRDYRGLISVPAAIVALIELIEKALRLIARLEWGDEAQD